MSNEPDEVNNGALATMIVIVALATLGVALVVTSLVRDEVGNLNAEIGGTQENEYRALLADQQGQLTAAPAYVDRAKGVVSVPVESAMKIVAEAVRENPLNLSPGTPPEEEEEAEEEASESEDDAEAEDGSDEAGEEELEADDKAPAPSETKTAPAPTAAPAPTPAPKAAPTTP
jgi:uncharacterized protein YhaN